MNNQWIATLIVVMAFLWGCASQPQSPPTPASTKPVAEKKHRPAVIKPPAKEPQLPEDKPLAAIHTKQRVKDPDSPAEIPPRAGTFSREPARRSGATPFKPKRETAAKAADSAAVRRQAPKPVVNPPKVPVKVVSPPARPAKAAVAKPLPVTKKPSIPKSVKKRAPAPTVTSRTEPSKASQADDKKPAATNSKAKKLADAASDAPVRSETELAMITKKSPADAVDRDMRAWVFDELHLPRTLPGGWVLDIRPDQMGKDRRCLLYSARTPIFDGYESSWVRLQITTDAIVVNTDSYVDTSYPGQGLRIDNGKLMSFMPDLLNKKSTYIKKPALAAMAKGTTLTVSLGFWPTWPVTKTQSVSIDLTGFKRAYAALKACSAAQ